MQTVTVSAEALSQLLEALNGPNYYIQELQVTRNPLVNPTNPIEVLIAEYNAAVTVYNASLKDEPKCPQ